ncbi:hypothetical protein GCM10011322_36470 [Salinarimonas ramus]|uniref:Type II toxin-antitoxin system prevent-host-death family antitoxin n=1 Tax=Salinarimonas ramus TaxID=690164 RepID=A0A917V702_9HYPH|nr:hypothetical protein GCM10011322_36470 [Salinarimonas ramus]
MIAAAERGEEVIIAHGGVPVVPLVPAKRRRVRLGLLEVVVSRATIPNFLEFVSEPELAEWSA